MRELPKYYTILFNAAEEAMRQLEQQNYGAAKEILLHGQRQAEVEYLAAEERDRKERMGAKAE